LSDFLIYIGKLFLSGEATAKRLLDDEPVVGWEGTAGIDCYIN